MSEQRQNAALLHRPPELSPPKQARPRVPAPYIGEVSQHEIIVQQHEVIEELREALGRLLNQPTMNPLNMTPEQRMELWAAHEQARAALAKATGSAS